MASDTFTKWRDTVMQSGPIAPLRFGLKQEEVIALFGEPDDESAFRKKGKPLILKYDDIEFHFDDQREHRLWLIHSEAEDGTQVRLSITDESAGQKMKEPNQPPEPMSGLAPDHGSS